MDFMLIAFKFKSLKFKCHFNLVLFMVREAFIGQNKRWLSDDAEKAGLRALAASAAWS